MESAGEALLPSEVVCGGGCRRWSPERKSGLGWVKVGEEGSKGDKTMTLKNENSNNTPNLLVISPWVDTKYCNRERSGEAGFMDNAKENIRSFFHASLDEYKACFKSTWRKMTERFQERKSAGLEGEKIPSEELIIQLPIVVYFMS
ncbi:hypothetical protein R6Q57_011790 [Mikania cordata]